MNFAGWGGSAQDYNNNDRQAYVRPSRRAWLRYSLKGCRGSTLLGMNDEVDRLTEALAARYRIDREIGAGGMATVYLAHDLRHGREVAIKVLRPDVAGQLGADRFLREIAVTASLDHPNVLPLLDSGDADGLLYYVMPFVRGESLRDRIARERQLPVGDAVQITRDISEALTHAHARGVVHRDVKPDNILLSGNHARVADFGIARALTEARGNTMTATGAVVGSPAYMSPEQAAGERDLDGRSDVYAVACVLYEMLAGQPPFSGPTQESLMRQHLVAPPPDVTQLRPLVPRHVTAALTRALAKSPADRFQSPVQFADALQLERPASFTPLGSRHVRILAIGGVLMVITAIATVAIRNRTASPTASERPLVVVLPFRNIGAAEDEYFADGLTEEITSRLTTISAIGTISRTTALSYKGSTKPLRQIARELGAAYILEGTVRTERLPNGTGQVRVTPELVRAESDTPLWTDRFTAGLAPGELFTVQAQIAERVASAFNVTLLERERRAIRRTETENSEAHTAYLLGRFHLAKATEAGLVEAIATFQRAVASDSMYARAYVGLADAYGSAPFFPGSPLPTSEAYARAATAARRAIALDSTLADAHASLGAVLANAERNWQGAEREYDAALRLDPGNAGARSGRSALLLRLHRYREAVVDAETAVQLEPASAGLRAAYAVALTYVGRLDDAVAAQQVALTLRPDFFVARVWLAEIAAIRGDLHAMGRELTKLSLAPVGRAMMAMGTDASSRRAVVQAIKGIKSPNAGLDAARQGWLFAVIGETGLALDAFEAATQGGSGISALQFPSVQRALGKLPRYQALVRNAGLPL